MSLRRRVRREIRAGWERRVGWERREMRCRAVDSREVRCRAGPGGRTGPVPGRLVGGPLPADVVLARSVGARVGVGRRLAVRVGLICLVVIRLLVVTTLPLARPRIRLRDRLLGHRGRGALVRSRLKGTRLKRAQVGYGRLRQRAAWARVNRDGDLDAAAELTGEHVSDKRAKAGLQLLFDERVRRRDQRGVLHKREGPGELKPRQLARLDVKLDEAVQ
jgi:hypothetical protein